MHANEAAAMPSSHQQPVAACEDGAEGTEGKVRQPLISRAGQGTVQVQQTTFPERSLASAQHLQTTASV